MTLRKLMPFCYILLAAGCSGTVSTGRQPVALVSAIASDKTDARHIILSSATGEDRFQDIAVLGSEASCAVYASMFETCDLHDNIDGRCLSDSLADFAGETISMYSFRYENGSSAESVATMTVRMAVAALDTACSHTSFDALRCASKNSCKTLILSSPVIDRYGRFEIDTLFAMTGCGVNVISPVSAMIAESGIRDGARIGFLCNPDIAPADVYKELLNESLANSRIHDAEAFVYEVKDTAGIMQSFLDAFAAADSGKVLDAILVGIDACDTRACMAELDSLVAIAPNDTLNYAGLVVPGIALTDELEAVATSCFHNLRVRNMFTHEIKLPQIRNYSGNALKKGDEDILILVPAE